MNLDRLKIPSLTCVTALGLLLANNVKPANALSFTESNGNYQINSSANQVSPTSYEYRFNVGNFSFDNPTPATNVKSWLLPLFGNSSQAIRDVITPTGWTSSITAWSNDFNSAPTESGKSTRTPTHLLRWTTTGIGIGYGNDTSNPENTIYGLPSAGFGFTSDYAPDLRVAAQVVLGNNTKLLIDPPVPDAPAPNPPEAVPTPSLLLGIGAVAYRAVKRRRQLSDDSDQGTVGEPIA
jgi:hypothetical protein